MGTNRSSGRTTSLDELLATADAATLGDLIRNLYEGRPDVQRKCLDFLRDRLLTTGQQAQEAASQSVLMLWTEIEPYVVEDRWEEEEVEVAGLLEELAERLRGEEIPKAVRRSIVGDGVMYVESTAYQDPLYGVLYAACYDDQDLRHLAGQLEGLARDWPQEHARRICRGLGDREKYLELRSRKMISGADYYDLVTFYQECGESERALTVAKEGLAKGQGRLGELRRFLSEHALRSGDRETYLRLQFEQAIVPRITVESYQTFRRLCTESEWAYWEPLALAAAANALPEERLQLHLVRGESEKAIAVLSALPYPWHYDNSVVLSAAASLEKQFPEQVLAFYHNGLGDTTSAHSRNEYARKARVLLKMRHMWADVMGKPDVWEKFARNIKVQNHRRPALQEEFGRAIPDWKLL